jgi:hypothetical protein
MIIPCLVLVVAMSVVSETWSCERTIEKITEPVKWVVSGDQMRAFRPAHPSGGKPNRVVQNDNRVVVAFSRVSNDATYYIIIDKTSGTLIEMDDIGLHLGWKSDFDKPDVYLGHCVQTAP